MNYKVKDKVRFRTNHVETIGQIVEVLEYSDSYRIIAPTMTGGTGEVVVPEQDVLGEADFDWK